MTEINVGYGLRSERTEWPMLCGVVVTKGGCYQVTESTVDATTLDATTMGAVTDVESGRYGIALSDGAVGARVTFVFRGRVDALAGTGAFSAVGAKLVVTTSEDIHDTAAAATKIVGIAKEVTAAASLGLVDFNGIEGFGTDVA